MGREEKAQKRLEKEGSRYKTAAALTLVTVHDAGERDQTSAPTQTSSSFVAFRDYAGRETPPNMPNM